MTKQKYSQKQLDAVPVTYKEIKQFRDKNKDTELNDAEIRNQLATQKLTEADGDVSSIKAPTSDANVSAAGGNTGGSIDAMANPDDVHIKALEAGGNKVTVEPINNKENSKAE